NLFVVLLISAPLSQKLEPLANPVRFTSTLAQMDVLDLMERRFVAEVHADFIERLEAGEIDTEQKQKKLLDAYAEELCVKRLEWANLQVYLVAGACFHHYLRPPPSSEPAFRSVATEGLMGLFRAVA
ncbi:hypothetical protein JZX89_28235, partial [Agrobacterium sp. Rnr]|nr:hypothetical protein [Agrobacterium burrii]